MIYYIGYYDCEKNSHEERKSFPAATNKMKYLISALEEIGEDVVEVVSPAETVKYSWVRGRRVTLGKQVSLKTFPSLSGRSKIVRAFGHLVTRLYFFLYLLTHVTDSDQMIVYHSLVYMKEISLVRKITKCALIMEVEEIYADVYEDRQLRSKEIQFLRSADKYIFITDLLRREIDEDKKFTIFHGTYRVMPNYDLVFQDGKTHVVYAGTFNPIKGGVFQAIAAAEYLDESYVLHILGGGSSSEIQNVKSKICEMSNKTKCVIRYDGYKCGVEFDAFIQACHIGLSTQQPEGKYNATSFPSKILMYMSNGIHVVSVRIPAVESSAVGSYMYYYDYQDAKSIAEAINAVPRTTSSGSKIILDRLHSEFVHSLRELLKR